MNGSTLREARIKLHIRQSDLALAAGISQSCLSLYELEKQEIPDYVQKRLCQALEISETTENLLSMYVDAHKEDVIRRIEQNLQKIRQFSLEELLTFEWKSENLVSSLSYSPDPGTEPGQMFINIPQLFSCSVCKTENGFCACDQMAEEGNLPEVPQYCNSLAVKYLERKIAEQSNKERKEAD